MILGEFSSIKTSQNYALISHIFGENARATNRIRLIKQDILRPVLQPRFLVSANKIGDFQLFSCHRQLYRRALTGLLGEDWSRREELNTPSAKYNLAALTLSYTGNKAAKSNSFH